MLADRAAEGTDEALADVLVSAWVKRPIHDGQVLYSCGMHLLGAPEVEIEVGAAHRPVRPLRRGRSVLQPYGYVRLTHG
ncbi:hypothetical protein [Nonomuraea jabiensis]|uniref:Uncharacterized protein n=1 Tax=Nonomuraea jabiensis TaxID=882448 RepID=A0A7W9LA09_9ACTN|nr:hypothetical protein [Nonomuraea jabiensis]MBB5776008.1 hypothetical protein [Nonomuraea jabiensis]